MRTTRSSSLLGLVGGGALPGGPPSGLPCLAPVPLLPGPGGRLSTCCCCCCCCLETLEGTACSASSARPLPACPGVWHQHQCPGRERRVSLPPPGKKSSVLRQERRWQAGRGRELHLPTPGGAALRSWPFSLERGAGARPAWGRGRPAQGEGVEGQCLVGERLWADRGLGEPLKRPRKGWSCCHPKSESPRKESLFPGSLSGSGGSPESQSNLPRRPGRPAWLGSAWTQPVEYQKGLAEGLQSTTAVAGERPNDTQRPQETDQRGGGKDQQDAVQSPMRP